MERGLPLLVLAVARGEWGGGGEKGRGRVKIVGREPRDRERRGGKG